MKKFVSLHILLSTLLFIWDCQSPIKPAGRAPLIQLRISEESAIITEEAGALREWMVKHLRDYPHDIDILLYGYSSGKEVLSYSGKSSGSVVSDIYKGSLCALIKLKSGSRLIRVAFLRSIGSGRKEIMDNMKADIEKLLKN